MLFILVIILNFEPLPSQQIRIRQKRIRSKTNPRLKAIKNISSRLESNVRMGRTVEDKKHGSSAWTMKAKTKLSSWLMYFKLINATIDKKLTDGQYWGYFTFFIIIGVFISKMSFQSGEIFNFSIFPGGPSNITKAEFAYRLFSSIDDEILDAKSFDFSCKCLTVVTFSREYKNFWFMLQESTKLFKFLSEPYFNNSIVRFIWADFYLWVINDSW